MTPLTEHFTWEEMTRTDNAGLQAQNRSEAITCKSAILATAEFLERIRAWSGPLQIHSGYRCPALNGAIVAAAARSQHMLGQAADFSRVGPKTPEAVDKLFQAVREYFRSNQNLSFGQLIREQRGAGCWVHLSLGLPWRDVSRCGEVLTMKDGVYAMMEKLG